MKKLIFVVMIILVASSGFAQNNAVATSKLAWDQEAVTLAEAQGYTYRYYSDNSATAVVFTGVTCTGTISPFLCIVPFPAFTPGNHTITLTAGNIAGESMKSTPFGFAFVVTPGTPVNIRIK